MTIEEAKKDLAVEREILRQLGKLNRKDPAVYTRITFQIARIGDLENFVITTAIEEENQRRKEKLLSPLPGQQ